MEFPDKTKQHANQPPPHSPQRCQQQHYGTAHHGLRLQDLLSPFHCRCHSLLTVLEAVQDAQTGLHRVQTASQDDVQVGTDAPHHDGSAPEGDSRLLRLSRGQFEGLALPPSVHSRERKPTAFEFNSQTKEITKFYFFQIPDYRNAVIVARNAGVAKKATSYAERLRLGIAVIHGEQKESETDEVDGRYSPPIVPK